jgi:hypothetical protein
MTGWRAEVLSLRLMAELLSSLSVRNVSNCLSVHMGQNVSLRGSQLLTATLNQIPLGHCHLAVSLTPLSRLNFALWLQWWTFTLLLCFNFQNQVVCVCVCVCVCAWWDFWEGGVDLGVFFLIIVIKYCLQFHPSWPLNCLLLMGLWLPDFLTLT